MSVLFVKNHRFDRESFEESKRKGLSFLQERYRFHLRAYERMKEWRLGASAGPQGHAIDLKKRVLWVETIYPGDHQAWLHEVAHIVCSPPWELRDPNKADEFAFIFGWEHAVAHWFHQNGYWNDKDLKDFNHAQAIYQMANECRYSEFGGLPDESQRRIINHSKEACQRVGLLDDTFTPTWARPNWKVPGVQAFAATTTDFLEKRKTR